MALLKHKNLLQSPTSVCSYLYFQYLRVKVCLNAQTVDAQLFGKVFGEAQCARVKQGDEEVAEVRIQSLLVRELREKVTIPIHPVVDLEELGTELN